MSSEKKPARRKKFSFPQTLSAASLLISAAFSVTVGILLIALPDLLAGIGTLLLAALLAVNGLSSLSMAFTGRTETGKKTSRIIRLVHAAVLFLMAAVLFVHPDFVASVLSLAFGVYALILSAVRFIVYGLYRRDRVQWRFLALLHAIILLVFGVLLLAKPLQRYVTVPLLLGIFFIAQGIFNSLSEAMVELRPQDASRRARGRLRIPLPVLFSSLIPLSVLNRINDFLLDEQHSDEHAIPPDDYNASKDGAEPDLELFVHVGTDGIHQFGHVDMAFDGLVRSYGGYDDSSMRLFGAISDGSYFTARKEDYIQVTNEKVGMAMFGFGIRLDEEQKARVRAELNRFGEKMVAWKPPAQCAAEAGEDPEAFDDYASLIWRRADGHFYKFTSGRFKTYFVLNTNCALFAYNILRKAGMDTLLGAGILSPGTYYNYLSREFLRSGSMVITRRVYHQPAGRLR